ncbi:MAG: hypothetical protein E4H10_03030 [Bacteroidia bacterium]|nr:MAG: hypothetical protein E4H10_03030 [Bacteroidia bacterium]
MLKRFLYAGVFAVVCLGLLTLFLIKRFDKTTPVELLQAIPGDAILFAENIDFEYLTESYLPGSTMWMDFLKMVGKNDLDSLIQLTLGQIRSSESLNDYLKKEGFNLSLHKLGRDQLTPLIYLVYSHAHGDHEFENMVLTLLEDKAMVNERKYEMETLYDVSGGPGLIPGKFTFTCTDGMCLISPSSMLVEEAIRTIHAGASALPESGFQMVRETAGRYVHANLYVNYKNLPDLFYPIIKESGWNRLDVLSNLASWGELDLDIKENAIILNGMSTADPDAPLFLGAFTGQSPVKMELHEILPAGTAHFLHLGIGDRTKFKEQILSYMKGLGQEQEYESEVQRLEQMYGFNPLEDLSRIVADEMAWFSIEGETRSKEQEMLIIETRSRSETVEVVMKWVEQYLQVHSFEMRSVRQVYRLDNQSSYNIYSLPDQFFKGTLAACLFNKYFTVFENYLIFGPSVDMLSRVIYQNVLHKTFVSDPVYKEISDHLSNRSNLTLFFRPYAYLEYKQELLGGKMNGKMEKLEPFLRRIPGVVVQYSTEGDLYYNSLSFNYTSQVKDKALTVWESLIDTMIVIKPALVLNHNTSEKEIFVQDAAGKVYLINSSGRILWKQPMEGPILGSVQQVDFYKNGKLQYLFNTSEKIHLIDRNGNYVERYPISLRSPATSPLALFDYDKSRDYRLFIATNDRKIYVYDIAGNLITGWEFGKTESNVYGEIQHFRVQGKDYIVATDQNRSYFLDRKGEERLRLKQRVVLSPQNPLTLDMNIREAKPRWISTDTAGNIMAVYMDGTVSTLLPGKASPKHFFRLEDLDSDGIPEFILATDNVLKVTNQDGERIFDYKVRGGISEMPDIYKFSASDVKIGITDRSRNKIYLINSDGSLYEGFPLEGTTRFSIGYFAGSDSRFNLIVGSENKFLYNYSIK